jgi:hypothetical protein
MDFLSRTRDARLAQASFARENNAIGPAALQALIGAAGMP